MVERFFRVLTEQSIRRGVFRSVAEVIVASEEHVRVHNAAPKPFIWTAKPRMFSITISLTAALMQARNENVVRRMREHGGAERLRGLTHDRVCENAR